MACFVWQHGQAISYALGGRAAVARVLKGFTREGCRRLRSTQAGLTVLNPFPSKARKRGGCLAVTLTRPVVLAGIEPAPLASVVEPNQGQTTSRPLSRFIYGRRALPPGTSPEFLPSGLRGSSQSTHHARRASISTDL